MLTFYPAYVTPLLVARIHDFDLSPQYIHDDYIFKPNTHPLPIPSSRSTTHPLLLTPSSPTRRLIISIIALYAALASAQCSSLTGCTVAGRACTQTCLDQGTQLFYEKSGRCQNYKSYSLLVDLECFSNHNF